MKKIITTLFFCAVLALGTASAQTWGKGDLKVGGNLRIHLQSGYNSFSFNPWGEYMLSDNFAVGGGLMLGYEQPFGTDEYDFNWAITPQIAYYYEIAPRFYLNPYAYVGLGSKGDDLGWSIGLVPQLSYQATNHWWVNIQLGKLSVGDLMPATADVAFDLQLNYVSFGVAFSF